MSDCKELSPAELREKLVSGNAFRLIDVRNPDEYEAVHVQRAECVPLPQLMERASQWHRNERLWVICQQGPRSQDAAGRLLSAGFTDVTVIEGGTRRCVSEGLPVVRGRRRLSVQQQTLMAIGGMVLAGLVGAVFFGPLIVLSWFGALGLIFAGATGFCPMAVVIGQAPWNRPKATPAPASKCGTESRSASCCSGG